MPRERSPSTINRTEMGLMGNAQPMAGADSERLFAAGVACICCEAWPMAYVCFERSAREDAPTRYNQALCCFHVEWYEESYRLLSTSSLPESPGRVLRPLRAGNFQKLSAAGIPTVNCPAVRCCPRHRATMRSHCSSACGPRRPSDWAAARRFGRLPPAS